MHQRLDQPDLLAVAARQLAQRAVEVGVEALGERRARTRARPRRAASASRSTQLAPRSRARRRRSRRAGSPCARGRPRRRGVTSRPRIRARPPVGRSRPSSTRIVVVLPAPLGPEEAEHLAGAPRAARRPRSRARGRSAWSAPSVSMAASMEADDTRGVSAAGACTPPANGGVHAKSEPAAHGRPGPAPSARPPHRAGTPPAPPAARGRGPAGRNGGCARRGEEACRDRRGAGGAQHPCRSAPDRGKLRCCAVSRPRRPRLRGARIPAASRRGCGLPSRRRRSSSGETSDAHARRWSRCA